MKTRHLDGAPTGGEASPAPWLPIADDPEELLQTLIGLVKPFAPEHFLRPCDTAPELRAIAEAACKALTPHTLAVGGRHPRKVIGDLMVKALDDRRADVFAMLARGLAKNGADNRAITGCIDALDKHGRVPSMAEVLEVLNLDGKAMTKRTLTRHLRRIGLGLRLPQSGKQGIAPRRSSR